MDLSDAGSGLPQGTSFPAATTTEENSLTRISSHHRIPSSHHGLAEHEEKSAVVGAGEICKVNPCAQDTDGGDVVLFLGVHSLREKRGGRGRDARGLI